MVKPLTLGSLARLIDTPELARVVPSLAPETLHQLIRTCGLDACGDLVAAATASQLQCVFDLDLWKTARPGEQPRFDADRFAEWLELFAHGEDAGAATTIASMDPKLVVAGLSCYVRVFDPATITRSPSSDGAIPDGETEDGDGAIPSAAECAIGGYLVRAVRLEAWDAIVTLLLTLEADHPDRFQTIMRGCRSLSNSTPERDGLDDLLLAAEQWLHDVAGDRDSRRSRQGYSTTADARAFLQLARQRRGAAGGPARNPIAADYFRAADEAGPAEDRRAAPASAQAGNRSPGSAPNESDARAATASFDAVVQLLTEAGMIPEPPRALLAGTHPQTARLTCIRRLMAHVHDRDIAAYAARSRELLFLANTLVAGCSLQSRSFTPHEAADVAIGVCNLGLEHWPARWLEFATTARSGQARALPDAFLADHDLTRAFEVGWLVLHEDVCMLVAKQLIAILSAIRCGDSDIRRDLIALRRELTIQWKAGTPWHARPALEVIATLDMPVWIGLLGLLAECPVLPAAVMATLDGHTRAVSATAFDCISTRRQLDAVRDFMARLPDLLQGCA